MLAGKYLLTQERGPTRPLKTSTSASNLATLSLNSSRSVSVCFRVDSRELIWSTRFWRYLRAARVLRVRFFTRWKLSRGSGLEGGSVESGKDLVELGEFELDPDIECLVEWSVWESNSEDGVLSMESLARWSQALRPDSNEPCMRSGETVVEEGIGSEWIWVSLPKEVMFVDGLEGSGSGGRNWELEVFPGVRSHEFQESQLIASFGVGQTASCDAGISAKRA